MLFMMHSFLFLVIFVFGSTCTIIKKSPTQKRHELLPNQKECGAVRPVPRVVGGHDAALGQFPWMAILGTKVSGEFKLICGGSIVNDRYIVTAAHCLPNENGSSELWVRLGEHDLSTSKDCTAGGVCAPPVQDIRVEKYMSHGEYGDQPIVNDIGLIRLEHGIEFNDFVSPLCLPTTKKLLSSSFENMSLEVAGWGINENWSEGESKPSRVLQRVTLPILPLERCQDIYGPLSSQKICAGGVEGRDSCSGDSGGPLMGQFSDNSPARYFLIGVVSYGTVDPCGQGPGVYSKVPRHVSWILDNIEK